MGKKKKEKKSHEMERALKKKHSADKKKEKDNKKYDKRVEAMIKEELKPGGVLYTNFNFLVDIGIVYELSDAFLYTPFINSIAVVDERYLLDVAVLDIAVNHGDLKYLMEFANKVYNALKIPNVINNRDSIVSVVEMMSTNSMTGLSFEDNHMSLINGNDIYPIGIYFTNAESKLLSVNTVTNVVIQKKGDEDLNIIISSIDEPDGSNTLMTNYKPIESDAVKSKDYDMAALIGEIFSDIANGKPVETI